SKRTDPCNAGAGARRAPDARDTSRPLPGPAFLYRAPPGHPPDFTAGARDCGNVQVFTLHYRRLEWHRSVRGTTKKSYPRKLLSSAWASWGFPWQDTWRGRATR